MTGTLLHLVATHGPLLVLLATACSAVGVPVPGSLAVMAGGAFAASGDMRLAAVATAALGGTLIGDQAGFWVGARGGPRAMVWAGRHGLQPAMDRARALAGRWGDGGNFASRFLASPLAPAVNLVSGTLGVPWARFTLFSTLGEIVWVGLYLALGHVFSRSLVAVAGATRDLGALLAAALVALALAAALRAHWRRAAAVGVRSP